jgi:Zn-dependent protease with chaperone function
MTSLDVPFALPWLAFAVTWFALGPVAVLLHRVLRHPLAAIEAPQRAVLLLALALLPIVGAAIVAVLGFAPQIGGLAVNAHCHATTGCGPHVPTLHASLVEAGFVGALLLLATSSVIWRCGDRLRRSLALADTLNAFATPAGREDFAVVESGEVFAYCVGLLRPRLVVSRGLLARLSAPQRDAVLAHERAHAARFDNLRQWLATVSLRALPRMLRSSLLRELAQAGEQSCDLAAVAAVGSANIAAALHTLGVQRERTAERLASLTAPSVTLPPTGVLALIVMGYTVCVLPSLDIAHYGLEVLLRWLG